MAVTQVARKARVYYGWYIVAVGFLAQFMANGLQAYTLGVFIKPIGDDLGWTRGEISGVQTVATVVNGLLAPFIGGIIDRRGGRTLMLIGAVISGIGFVSLSLMQELWHFYLLRGLVITMGTLLLGNLVVNVSISNWFVRKRGRAIAFGSMGISFAGVALAPLSQVLIDSFGWRIAWIGLGVMIWVVMLVPIALFIRRRPEDMGLRPDGDSPTGVNVDSLSEAQKEAMKADVRWTRAEAIRRPSLWMIAVAFGFSGMGLSAMSMHTIPYVSDLGFSAAIAAGALSVQAAFSMMSKFCLGFILERVRVRYVAISSFALAATGLGLLMSAHSLEMIYLALAVFGSGVGAQSPLQDFVWANYFGRLTLGTVRSIGMPFMIISNAGGPLIAGIIYDHSRSYQGALVALIFAYATAVVLLLLLRPPRPPKSIG